MITLNEEAYGHPRMTLDEMGQSMESLFAGCGDLRKAGQKEYAGGANAFGNFNRLAKQLNTTPEKILWVYVTKHFDGIVAYINGHVSQRESVNGRIKDAIVYLGLLNGMVEARSKGLIE